MKIYAICRYTCTYSKSIIYLNKVFTCRLFWWLQHCYMICSQKLSLCGQECLVILNFHYTNIHETTRRTWIDVLTNGQQMILMMCNPLELQLDSQHHSQAPRPCTIYKLEEAGDWLWVWGYGQQTQTNSFILKPIVQASTAWFWSFTCV